MIKTRQSILVTMTIKAWDWGLMKLGVTPAGGVKAGV